MGCHGEGEGNVKPRRAHPEYDMQCALVKHIEARRLPNVYWTAIPNGEKRSKATGARLKRMGVRAGAPDMLFVVNGVAHGLELKAGKGTPSLAQIATRMTWQNAAGIYAVAHGMDEALAALVAWGVIQPEQKRIGRAG
jgi:hypothetical protein